MGEPGQRLFDQSAAGFSVELAFEEQIEQFPNTKTPPLSERRFLFEHRREIRDVAR